MTRNGHDNSANKDASLRAATLHSSSRAAICSTFSSLVAIMVELTLWTIVNTPNAAGTNAQTQPAKY